MWAEGQRGVFLPSEQRFSATAQTSELKKKLINYKQDKFPNWIVWVTIKKIDGLIKPLGRDGFMKILWASRLIINMGSFNRSTKIKITSPGNLLSVHGKKVGRANASRRAAFQDIVARYYRRLGNWRLGNWRICNWRICNCRFGNCR